MKKIKVCRKCGSVSPAVKHFCINCGEKLPRDNLFKIYQKEHKHCDICGTVLSDLMVFCPQCGAKQD